MVDGHKICTACGTSKPTSAFSADNRSKTGLQARCKQCYLKYESARASYRSAYNKVHRDKRRKQYLQRKYNMSLADYNTLLASQNGRCAICRSEDPGGYGFGAWTVDHDHACCSGAISCGKCIRALLCHTCNVGIGSLRDDQETVYAAFTYLAQHGPPLIGGPDAAFELIPRVLQDAA